VSERAVIVNADDFGRSRGINEGVAVCHERGIVTSASLMVRAPAADEAAEYAERHPGLSVGLHVDLAEWTVRDGSWRPLYERVDEADAAAVAAEIRSQLAAFRELLGRDPTHLDGHQHAHRDEPARSIMLELADELRVPLRDFAPGVRYSGSFYGQGASGEPLAEAISVEALRGIIAGLPPGVTELGCHPAAADDLDSMYLAERMEEVRALCDPRVRAALDEAEVELISFADLGKN
jgi:chitin disaccharide deacetylase